MARIGVGTSVGRFFVFSTWFAGGIIYSFFVILGFISIAAIFYAIIHG